MKTNEERLQDLFAYLDRQTHVQPEEIPNIDLYMDQVTTFMEEHLKNTRRYEEESNGDGSGSYDGSRSTDRMRRRFQGYRRYS